MGDDNGSDDDENVGADDDGNAVANEDEARYDEQGQYGGTEDHRPETTIEDESDAEDSNEEREE